MTDPQPVTGSAADTSDVPEWRLKGDWWDMCNCAIGCPCVFSSPPTHGFCEGVHAWIIREGNYGDVQLDGFGVVIVMRFEGTVFDKNREFGFLIDERADAAQRDALTKIFTGRAGGTFAAWADLTLRLDGVEFAPMTLSYEAETWRVDVPGLVEGHAGPFRKYMVPEGETCRIYNAPRPEVTPGYLTLGQAIKNIVTGAFGRTFDWMGGSSKYIEFDLRGPQAFTWRKSLQAQASP